MWNLLGSNQSWHRCFAPHFVIIFIFRYQTPSLLSNTRNNYLLKSLLMWILFFSCVTDQSKLRAEPVCKQPFQSALYKAKNSRENIISVSHFFFLSIFFSPENLIQGQFCIHSGKEDSQHGWLIPSLWDSSFQKDSMLAQVGFSVCFSVLGQETQEVLKRSAGWRQTFMPRADQVKERLQFTPGQCFKYPGTLLRTAIASECSWQVFKCQS